MVVIAFLSNFAPGNPKNKKQNYEKKILSVIIASTCAFQTIAQETAANCETCNRLVFDTNLSAYSGKNDINPIALQLHCGYQLIPRLSVFAGVEGTVGFRHQHNGYGDYFSSNSIGGGVEYALMKASKSYLPPINNVFIHAASGTSIGHYQWKYTYYEIGATLSFREKNTPTFGIGYRYMDSRKDGISDMKGLYVSIGIRW